MTCSHAPAANPRLAASCCKCGKLLDLPTRDRAWEREATQRIAGDMVDVSGLTVMAQRRADQGQAVYGFDFPALDRDLEQEGMEEAADGCIYAIWRLDGIRRDLYEGDEERIANLQMAVKGFTIAFNALRNARR